MMKFFLLLSWTILSFDQPGFAQEREMILPVPQSAYSQAVKVKGGTLVFLSGVGPTDEKGILRAPGDYRGRSTRPGSICAASWRVSAAR